MTPRRAGDRGRGSGTFVVRDGALVAGQGAAAAWAVRGGALSPACCCPAPALTLPRCRPRCAGEVLGDRVASSKIDMNEARSLNASLIKRQYFGRMPSRLEPFFSTSAAAARHHLSVEPGDGSQS
jgi:hypothetical protein